MPHMGGMPLGESRSFRCQGLPALVEDESEIDGPGMHSPKRMCEAENEGASVGSVRRKKTLLRRRHGGLDSHEPLAIPAWH